MTYHRVVHNNLLHPLLGCPDMGLRRNWDVHWWFLFCFDFLCRSFQSNHPRGPKGPIDSQQLKMEQVKHVLQQPAAYNIWPDVYNTQNSKLHRAENCTKLKIALGSKLHTAQKLQRPKKCTELKIATDLKLHQSWIILVSPTLLTIVAEKVLL